MIMSLNCLPCHHLRRIESGEELNENCDIVGTPCYVQTRSKVDRSWSGNLAPRPYDHKFVKNESADMVGKKGKKGHQRVQSISGPIGYKDGPRLVRSSGMRRDWSFEDLGQKREEKIKAVQRCCE